MLGYLVSSSLSLLLLCCLMPIHDILVIKSTLLLIISLTFSAAAGKLLHDNNFKFDMAYTSCLKRAIRTLWHSLEQVTSLSETV